MKQALLFLLVILMTTSTYGSKVTKYQTSVTVKNHKKTECVTVWLRVTKPEDVHLAQVVIGYQKGDEVQIKQAETYDNTGKLVRKSSKKEIITTSQFSSATFHADALQKEISLGWTSYPFEIRYSYEITSSEFIYVAGWVPYLDETLPVEFASLEVVVDKDYQLRYDQTDDFEADSVVIGSTKKYHWVAKNLKPISRENYAPEIFNIYPSVMVVPLRFTYGVDGQFDSWESYGSWQYQTNEGLDELPQAEKFKVNRLLVDVNDSKDKIQILYNYLQDETRYINVSLKIGGLKPYPASYVSANKFGDCKALTIYMKALLKYADIESYYTKVFAGEIKRTVKESFPSQQFNHVILCVPLENDTIWIENTASYLPFGYTGTFTQGRKGLLVKAEESVLVDIPALVPEDVAEVRSYVVTLGEDSITLSLDWKTTGDQFETIRYYHQADNNKKLEKLVGQSLHFNHIKQLSWAIEHFDRNAHELKFQVNANLGQKLKRIEDFEVLPKFSLETPNLESPKERSQPLFFPYPVNEAVTVKYVGASLLKKVIELPEDYEVQSAAGLYRATFNQVEGEVIARYNLQISSGSYGLEDYPEIFAFFKRIKKHQKRSAILLKRKS